VQRSETREDMRIIGRCGEYVLQSYIVLILSRTYGNARPATKVFHFLHAVNCGYPNMKGIYLSFLWQWSALY